MEGIKLHPTRIWRNAWMLHFHQLLLDQTNTGWQQFKHGHPTHTPLFRTSTAHGRIATQFRYHATFCRTPTTETYNLWRMHIWRYNFRDLPNLSWILNKIDLIGNRIGIKGGVIEATIFLFRCVINILVSTIFTATSQANSYSTSLVAFLFASSGWFVNFRCLLWTAAWPVLLQRKFRTILLHHFEADFYLV